MASGPHLRHEKQYIEMGYKFVAGVDEVGMGCLAGPVIAAAVILDLKNVPKGINDSKKLSPAKREKIAEEIRQSAIAYAIGEASVDEIDSINIYHAARLAMKRAVLALSQAADYLLIDGNGKLDIATPHLFIVKGDSISVSIGGASIIAKVHRDRMMAQMDDIYPGYGFASHKGYASLLHRTSIQRQGPTPIHRKSFSWGTV